jgi:hypothetical protein
MTPLPTRWIGWWFRSRTEARWAVFFNDLGIEFEYEPEGFSLSDGTWYLPDFWLPQIEMFAEVKPGPPTDIEFKKAKLLAHGSKREVLFLDGAPDFKSYQAATWDCDQYTVCDYSLDIDAHGRSYYLDEHRLFSCPGPMSESNFTDRYRQAVYAAREQRFDEEGPCRK